MTGYGGAAHAGSSDGDDRVLVVDRVVEKSCEVRELVLVDPAGESLDPYQPGSSVTVTCGAGADGRARRNPYALTGAGAAPGDYSISVRLDPAGRGGSAWLHSLEPGSRVTVGRPVAGFAPVPTARHHLFVAGGIGVAPVLSHARAAAQSPRSFGVLYGYRRQFGAHLDELSDACGDRLSAHRTRVGLLDSVRTALVEQPMGAHLYVCGPPPMAHTVVEMARVSGWPTERIHVERFTHADPLAVSA